jgi:hypothetical protein
METFKENQLYKWSGRWEEALFQVWNLIYVMPAVLRTRCEPHNDHSRQVSFSKAREYEYVMNRY